MDAMAVEMAAMAVMAVMAMAMTWVFFSDHPRQTESDRWDVLCAICAFRPRAYRVHVDGAVGRDEVLVKVDVCQHGPGRPQRQQRVRIHEVLARAARACSA